MIGDDDDVVIAAISVAELYAGIESADQRNRARRSEYVAHLLELIPVELYDLSIAEAHGRLMADVHRTGTRRGAHDLIIAATAAVTRRTIVTTDQSARFGELPGWNALCCSNARRQRPRAKRSPTGESGFHRIGRAGAGPG